MADLNLLRDLALTQGAAVVTVAALRRLGVPTIAGFILAGFALGPDALGVIRDEEAIHLLAEVGVVLLLFGIGLEMSLDRLRRLWRQVLIGGALQVTVTLGIAALLGRWWGLGWRPALFLGMLAAVSSTAIVLRGLAERRELETSHGRLSLGVLVFQDLSVVPMMLTLPLLTGGGGTPAELTLALGSTVGVVAGVLVAARLVIPTLLHQIARTQQRDLFLLTVLVVCILTAWAVGLAGVPLSLGAFLGGLVVAGSSYRHQALAEIIPFREAFASLFFVSVGMMLHFSGLAEGWMRIGALVLGVIQLKFLVVVGAALLLGLTLRAAVRAGSALAQVGEFSFVLLVAGAGVLPPQLEADVTAAAILTMLVTPVGIALGPQLGHLAERMGPLRRLFQREEGDLVAAGNLSGHVVVAGYGVAGHELGRALRQVGLPWLVVDLNPGNLAHARRDGALAIYGDITSPEVLEHLHLERAGALVLTISDYSANLRAVQAARRVSAEVPIEVRALYAADIEALRQAGATEVFSAEIATAIEMVASILRRTGVSAPVRTAQLEALRERWERGGVG
ncbi:MAG: cation:proton antiporter [Deltaproteobacteria bacterium]|nr:cation:proton antiporter [Deltaproteobacteria bacterium]